MKARVLLAVLAICACSGPRKLPEAPLASYATIIAPKAPARLHALPTASTTAAGVLRDYRTADRLALAYAGSPGVTVDGLKRLRQLSAAADRAVALMKHRGHPEDVKVAAAAVAELINQAQ